MSCNNSSGICAFGNSWWWIIVLVIIFVLWNGNGNSCGCGCDNGCCEQPIHATRGKGRLSRPFPYLGRLF